MSLGHSAGFPIPLGASPLENGVNFSIFSRDASCIYLDLFEKSDDGKPFKTIKLDPLKNKTGDVWHIFVEGITKGTMYLYRAEGKFSPEKGFWFNKNVSLLDPYAKELTVGSIFNSIKSENLSLFPKCIVIDDKDFDWEGDEPLHISMQDSIIYELHVRGYTKSPSSNVENPGTYAGLIEKIPYLKKLGITAVELLPIFEFDENENENERKNPDTSEQLKNFWGYSTAAFFAPKASYASFSHERGPVNEFKLLVKKMHEAGIEVILDVVFNHSAEGNHKGFTFSFRGLANDVYYILDDKNKLFYKDYTGCGNTMNCNHPIMVQFILDCLHYWVLQMHVDGFRFDLASVLCRAESGDMEMFPYLTRAISEDPVLKNSKLIAEPWDAVGAYQAGHFPGGRWCSWNDKFRDGMRRFLRGEDFMSTEAATRISGSSDLYTSPTFSINFITAHDGFTLNDTVSYTSKRNKGNSEDNKDGTGENFSYNNGFEGETDNALVESRRLVSIKNMILCLVLAQGVPMILAGDEFRRTQKGNNNAYCQDNAISWIDWNLCTKNENLVRYVQKLIELRKNHQVFRRTSFFKGGDLHRGILPDILWYNENGTNPDWSCMKRFLACRLDGNSMHFDSGITDNDFYLAINMGEIDVAVMLPPLPADKSWRRVADTSILSAEDICDSGSEEILPSQKRYVVPAHSIVLLLSEDVLQNIR